MLSDDEQTALARRLHQGDRNAWNALYDEYSERVWRYVARLLGSDSVAIGDVVQEVFIAAARSAKQFDPARGSLWRWLTGIAHFRITAYWKQEGRQARWRQMAEAEGAALLLWLDSDRPLDDLLERRELAELVRGVLASLSVDYATLLTSKYIDEQTLEQLVGEQGGSLDAVKSKLARARREFRVRFEQLSQATAKPS